MNLAIAIPFALSLFLSPAIMAQQGGGSNPNCPDGFDATVSGPRNCNCMSNDIDWIPTHWDTYQGPSGRGSIVGDDGSRVTGTITGGSTGFTGSYLPSVTVPAGKCAQIVYDFFCCPVPAGTNCSGTGSITFVETDAVCP